MYNIICDNILYNILVHNLPVLMLIYIAILQLMKLMPCLASQLSMLNCICCYILSMFRGTIKCSALVMSAVWTCPGPNPPCDTDGDLEGWLIVKTDKSLLPKYWSGISSNIIMPVLFFNLYLQFAHPSWSLPLLGCCSDLFTQMGKINLNGAFISRASRNDACYCHLIELFSSSFNPASLTFKDTFSLGGFSGVILLPNASQSAELVYANQQQYFHSLW